MPFPRPGTQKLMSFWGTIETGARQRSTSSAMWQLLRAEAGRRGQPLEGVSGADLGPLWSRAVQIRNASERFARLGSPGTITADMITEAPWARSAEQMGLSPRFDIRFELTTIGPEGPVTSFKSWVEPLAFPETKDELLSRLQDYAEGLADRYEHSFGGIGTVQLLAV